MATNWTNIINRISPKAPQDLDPLVGVLDPRRAKNDGAYLVPASDDTFDGLTPLKGEETICFGARITKDTPDPVALAMRVAQLAAEKGAEAIVLSHVEKSGLERFGFRVETVGGETKQARLALEDELRRFWNIVVVI